MHLLTDEWRTDGPPFGDVESYLSAPLASYMLEQRGIMTLVPTASGPQSDSALAS